MRICKHAHMRLLVAVGCTSVPGGREPRSEQALDSGATAGQQPGDREPTAGQPLDSGAGANSWDWARRKVSDLSATNGLLEEVCARQAEEFCDGDSGFKGEQPGVREPTAEQTLIPG